MSEPKTLIEAVRYYAERGAQISDYLRSNPATSYVVIDDLDLGIRAAGHPFVQTDGQRGLTEADALEAINLLTPAL